MATIPFGTQLIGRTEKALNALLERELSGTGLTEPQWVALTLTNATSGAPTPGEAAAGAGAPARASAPGASAPGSALSAEELAARISEALRTDKAASRRLLSELIAAGLVHETADHTVEPTPNGRSLWLRVRSATGALTTDLWDDLPAEDRAAAARVLNVVLARAGTALSAKASECDTPC